MLWRNLIFALAELPINLMVVGQSRFASLDLTPGTNMNNGGCELAVPGPLSSNTDYSMNFPAKEDSDVFWRA